MKNHKIHLQYTAACRLHNKIWFLNGGFNGLFSLNLDDFSLEYKRKTPIPEGQGLWAYGDTCCSYEDKLFFFPAGCRQILTYDVVTDIIQEISIFPADNSSIYTTHGIFQSKNQIWIFPRKLAQGIFILDLQTLQIKQDIELRETLSDVEYIYKLIKLNEMSIAILTDNNTIMEIDIQKKQKTYCRYFGEDINIWSINQEGNSYWLLQSNSTNVYEWNQIEDRLIKYQLVETDWLTIGGVSYKDILFVKDQIILLGNSLKYLMKINKKERTISKAIDYPEGFKFLNNQFEKMKLSAFGAYNVIDNKVILHPLISNMLLIYDIEKDNIEGKELVVTSEELPFLKTVIEEGFKMDGVFYEVEDFGYLEDFLDNMMDKKYLNNQDKRIKNIGKKIYRSVLM